MQTKEDIPKDIDIRSCVILERTPPERLKTKPDAGERTYRINIGGRLPRSPLKSPDRPGKTYGASTTAWRAR